MGTNNMWPSMLKFVSNLTKAVIIIVTAGFSSMAVAQTAGDSASVGVYGLGDSVTENEVP